MFLSIYLSSRRWAGLNPSFGDLDDGAPRQIRKWGGLWGGMQCYYEFICLSTKADWSQVRYWGLQFLKLYEIPEVHIKGAAKGELCSQEISVL